MIRKKVTKHTYVVSFPSLIGNDGDGSLSHPYSSLQQALDHIENEYYHGINSVRRTTINLYPTHHFVDTIHFTQARYHTHLTTMSVKDSAFYDEIAAQEHSHRRLSKASISGGMSITGWTQMSGNTLIVLLYLRRYLSINYSSTIDAFLVLVFYQIILIIFNTPHHLKIPIKHDMDFSTNQDNLITNRYMMQWLLFITVGQHPIIILID